MVCDRNRVALQLVAAATPYRIILLAGTLVVLAGCAPDLQALSQDHNSDCIRVTWIYGSAEINRNHGCDPITSSSLLPSVAK